MRRIWKFLVLAAALTALIGGNATAHDKAAYERRSIERYENVFRWLDNDRDDAVSLSEPEGNLHFLPVFDDMDINRDGSVTKAELERYLTARYRASGSHDREQ